jgi:hypothetical protein
VATGHQPDWRAPANIKDMTWSMLMDGVTPLRDVKECTTENDWLESPKGKRLDMKLERQCGVWREERRYRCWERSWRYELRGDFGERKVPK